MSTMAQVKPLIDSPREFFPAKVISIDDYRPETRAGIDVLTFDERISYIRKYGDHCMSFSMLQPEMHFFDMPGVGFITYRKKWGTRFVLADPVCDVKDRELLVREFLKERTNTAFIQISQGMAEFLHGKFGYYATQFGVESVVDLEKWDLKGKKKQVLRTSVNHAKKDSVTIEENCSEDGCHQLTKEWLKTRKVRNREVAFLIRPMDQEYQEGTRKFCAYHDGKLVGFIFFDPLYKDGKVFSYVPNISRFSNKFKQGIFYPLMCHAMEVFKKEGVKYLHLGLCPAVVDEKDEPYESKLLKMIIRLIYKYGNMLYSFKGLYFTKSRFEGVVQKTFCAHREILPSKSMLTVFMISNIL